MSLQKESHHYLESLHKKLLTKGKPLACVYLNAKDLPLLKKILYHCGFEKADVERLSEDLSENNPGGEINFFQFYLKLNELLPVMNAECQTSSTEPAVTPHIDFMLRNFGLTPNEVNGILNTSRMEDGGMDLDRLIINLKDFVGQTGGQKEVTIDQGLWQQVAGKIEQTGIQTKNRGQGVQISMDDFIKTLEEVTGPSDRKNQLPPNVKATIEQILAKVVISDERYKPAVPLLIPSDPRYTDPFFKEKISPASKAVEKERGLFPLKAKGTLSENENRLTPIQKSVAADAGERFHSPGSGAGSINAHNQEQDLESLYHPKNVSSFFEDSHHPGRSTSLQPTNTNKFNGRPGSDSLPAYLIDQVGKQLSRSILRGDQVVRLKMKPPDLGLLKINIDIKENVLKLGMIAENHAVKELLLSNVHELREALVEQGVKLERIDIQMNHGFGQSQPDSKEWFNKGQREGQRFNDRISMSGNNMDRQQTEHTSEMIDDHLLNIVA